MSFLDKLSDLKVVKDDILVTIYFAKMDGQDVAFKVYFDIPDEESLDKSEMTEIYKKDRRYAKDIFNKLFFETALTESLSDHRISHFVRFIDYKRIRINDDIDKLDFLTPKFKESFKYFKGVRLHFSIMERKKGTKDLAEVLPTLNDKEIKSVIFQIIYSVYRLNKAGFQHNDLHPGNILVDTSHPDEVEKVEHRGKKYNINLLRSNVILFDWDLATSKDLENPYLEGEMCEGLGICNNVNLKFDMYTILSSVMFMMDIKIFKDKELNAFIDDVLGDRRGPNYSKLVPKGYTYNFNHRLCKSVRGKCAPLKPNEPESVMTPDEALQHSYFDSMIDSRVSRESYI
jgi:serine/threonine protein kinase